MKRNNNMSGMDGFHPVDQQAAKDFAGYARSNFCGDTAYSQLYAWAEHFDYRYRMEGDTLIVTGRGIESDQGFLILRRDEGISIREAVKRVVSLCDRAGIHAIFEYVNESDIDRYREIASECEREITVEYKEKYSDYLYPAEEYLCISGGKNKSRRGSLNFLRSHFPNLHLVQYTRERYADGMAVFDQWCSAHACEDCFYGCERKAFARILEIYDRVELRVYLAYDGDRPLAVSVFEKINGDTLCCYFHKNAGRIRGLTYWLSRNVLETEACSVLNLGEDMGIPGIITDKSSLHPSGKVKKYIITFSQVVVP